MSTDITQQMLNYFAQPNTFIDGEPGGPYDNGLFINGTLELSDGVTTVTKEDIINLFNGSGAEIEPPLILNGTGENEVPGHVSVTNGSPTVTGTGTHFTSSFTQGSSIIIDEVAYTVLYITSDTSLTLTANYTGETASGLFTSTDENFIQCNTSAGNTIFQINPNGVLIGNYANERSTSIGYLLASDANGTVNATTSGTLFLLDVPTIGAYPGYRVKIVNRSTGNVSFYVSGDTLLSGNGIYSIAPGAVAYVELLSYGSGGGVWSVNSSQNNNYSNSSFIWAGPWAAGTITAQMYIGVSGNIVTLKSAQLLSAIGNSTSTTPITNSTTNIPSNLHPPSNVSFPIWCLAGTLSNAVGYGYVDTSCNITINTTLTGSSWAGTASVTSVGCTDFSVSWVLS